MIPAAIVAAAIALAAPKLEPDLIARYAADIAAAAEDDLELAVALVVTADAEGGWDEAVEHCQCKPWECDQGRAVSLYQLHEHWLGGHAREEVCQDNRLATELAAKGLAQLRRLTGSWAVTFARYRGVTRTDDPRVKARVRRFHWLVRGVQDGS